MTTINYKEIRKDSYISSLLPTSKQQKIFYGEGLYLFIPPQGKKQMANDKETCKKTWRIKYTLNGKQKDYTIGKYPIYKYKDAIAELVKVKALLAEGIDPNIEKQKQKLQFELEANNTFEAIASEWIESNSSKWSQKHTDTTIGRLRINIYPYLGKRPINQITPVEFRDCILKATKRGVHETANRTRAICSQVFNYAISNGKCEKNPAEYMKGQMQKVNRNHFATITEPTKIAVLLNKIDKYHGSLTVGLALKIAPHVFLRSSELREARWQEINFDTRLWTIPAERMKMKKAHTVPLSKQVIELLNKLQSITGDTPYLFPSLRTNKPISDNALLKALKNLAMPDKMTVHGFRSMASTLLNEQGYNYDVIERQLAHSDKDKIRAAYNFAEYLEERRHLMQEWSNYLETLKLKGYFSSA